MVLKQLSIKNENFENEQFFGSTELENGFEKSKDFITYWLKAFLSDTPQSIKHQNLLFSKPFSMKILIVMYEKGCRIDSSKKL